MTPADRLAARSEALAEPCVIWQGARNADGYGVLRDGERVVYAHRMAFEGHHGRPAAEGHDVHHVCRNRLCIEPAHLEEIRHGEHVAEHNRERTRAA